MLGVSCRNKLDAATKLTKRFSNPQALSSALAVLGMLQPWAFGLLNNLVHLVLVPYYCLSNILLGKIPSVMLSRATFNQHLD